MRPVFLQVLLQGFKLMRDVLRVAAVALLTCVSASKAQSPISLDDPNTPAVQSLQLGDPFFELVIKASPQPKLLQDVEAAIQPQSAERLRFAVDERLQSKAPGLRRAVLSFEGRTVNTEGVSIDVDGTVMLSVSFAPRQLPAVATGTEAWGWDAALGRFNYYKLEGNNWTFAGSSAGPEVQAKTGCMACHHNGVPIMKELIEPWANWHSSEDQILHLFDGPWNPPAARIFPSGAPNSAEELEGQILQMVSEFHDHEIDRAKRRLGPDLIEITNARALLAPIFQTTEINLGSAQLTTGALHPFSATLSGPGGTLEIPNTHFLNARVLASGGFPGASTAGSLNIADAQMFKDAARMPAETYASIVQAADLRLATCVRTNAEPRGDARFAWLHPEPGLFDVMRVQQLMLTGIIDAEFLAAAMAVDLRVPVFSEKRANLLRFVPTRFRITTSGPIDLHDQVLAALDGAAPLPPHAKLFRDRLASGHAQALLKEDVTVYLEDVKERFTGSAEDIEAAAQKEFSGLLATRQKMLDNPNTCQLVEGPLLPLPATP